MKISLKPQYFSLTVIAVLLASCSQNEENNILTDTNGVCFTASIGQDQTRATEESFETNDTISVFAFKNESGFSGEKYAHNKKYSFQNQQFIAEGENVIKQSADGSQLSYVAVYPYSEAADASFTFQVREDQAVGNNYTRSDLMMASTDLTDNQTPSLVFSHCLSDIVVNLSFAKAPAGDVSVKIINVSTSVSADLATATFIGNGETNRAVTAAYNGTNSYKAILPPQTTNKGNTGIEISIGNNAPISYLFPEAMEWKSGIRYNYTFYIDEEGNIRATPNITKRLKKEIWESTLENEMHETEFYYDEKGRLSKLIISETDEYGTFTRTEDITYTEQTIKVIVSDNEGEIYQATCYVDENNRITQITEQFIDPECLHTTQFSYTDGNMTKITSTSSPQYNHNYSWTQNNQWENGNITNIEVLNQITMDTEKTTLKYSENPKPYKSPRARDFFIYEDDFISAAYYLPESYWGTKVNGLPIETKTTDYEVSTSHYDIWQDTYTIEADEDNYITKIIKNSIVTDLNGTVTDEGPETRTFTYEVVTE